MPRYEIAFSDKTTVEVKTAAVLDIDVFTRYDSKDNRIVSFLKLLEDPSHADTLDQQEIARMANFVHTLRLSDDPYLVGALATRNVALLASNHSFYKVE